MELILKTSLLCTGIFIAFNGKDMILNGAANFLSFHLHPVICKPLFECLPCMGSVYTIAMFLIHKKEFDEQIIITIFAVVGLNAIISAIIKPLFDEVQGSP